MIGSQRISSWWGNGIETASPSPWSLRALHVLPTVAVEVLLWILLADAALPANTDCFQLMLPAKAADGLGGHPEPLGHLGGSQR
jgi:hypothetical protein